MRIHGAPLLLVAGFLLQAPCPVAAQDEASFQEQAQLVGRLLQQMNRALVEEEKLLERRLRILSELTDGAHTLAKSAPETGRSAALQAVENARRIAEEEPPLPEDVLLALDRSEVEVGRRGGIGESGSGAADRFLTEILALERSTSEAIERFVGAAESIRGSYAQGAFTGDRAIARGAQALERLFLLHRLALDVRDTAP